MMRELGGGSPRNEGYRDPPQEDHGAVELGTVGHSDKAGHYEVGTGENDGNTLVFVTLFRGRDPDVEQTPEFAQGIQVVARIHSDGLIPKKGSQVLVARPAGIDGPGAWHIIANPGAADPGPVLAAEGGTFIRRGRDGTVSIGTTHDGTPNGKTIYLQIRRDGLRFFSPWGKVTFDPGGFHVLHSSGARFDLGGIGGLPSPADQLSSYATLGATLIGLRASLVPVGPESAPADAAAKSTPTIAAIGAIQTYATLVQTALAAIGAALPPGPSVAAATAAIAAAATGLTAMGTALGVATLALPSTSETIT